MRSKTFVWFCSAVYLPKRKLYPALNCEWITSCAALTARKTERLGLSRRLKVNDGTQDVLDVSRSQFHAIWMATMAPWATIEANDGIPACAAVGI